MSSPKKTLDGLHHQLVRANALLRCLGAAAECGTDGHDLSAAIMVASEVLSTIEDDIERAANAERREVSDAAAE